MSQVTKRGPVKPNLNITPLIDVVFLLIVFFMLVQNIVTDEIPQLKLPDLHKAQTFEGEQENRIIINIMPDQEWEGDPGPGTDEGEVLARGGEAAYIKVGGKKFEINDSEGLKAFNEFMVTNINARKHKGPIKFMLRGDAAIYYSNVLPVIAALQDAMVKAELDPDAGATAVHIVAYMPND